MSLAGDAFDVLRIIVAADDAMAAFWKRMTGKDGWNNALNGLAQVTSAEHDEWVRIGEEGEKALVDARALLRG